MKNQNIPMRRLFTSFCALLVLFGAFTASAQTDSVIDPLGDAFYRDNGNGNGTNNEAPAFLDILAASITISDTLTLTVDVAGSLDALPNPPGSDGFFDWHFPLNTNNSTDPQGYPLPPGQSAPADFFADARWDGTAFSGVFADRRPELMDQPALVYSIPVSVSGSRITITVPAALAAQVRAAVVLPGATWNCTTLLATGNHGVHGADDIGGRRPWPQ
jgi:hypothetical protein